MDMYPTAYSVHKLLKRVKTLPDNNAIFSNYVKKCPIKNRNGLFSLNWESFLVELQNNFREQEKKMSI